MITISSNNNDSCRVTNDTRSNKSDKHTHICKQIIKYYSQSIPMQHFFHDVHISVICTNVLWYLVVACSLCPGKSLLFCIWTEIFNICTVLHCISSKHTLRICMFLDYVLNVSNSYDEQLKSDRWIWYGITWYLTVGYQLR